MKTMHDLVTGDELNVYMRQSLPLEVGRTAKGVEYRYVPRRRQKASSAGLSRFRAVVVSNDTVNNIITVNTVGINSRGNPLSTSPPLKAEISYTALDRVFLLSAFHYEPREELRRGGNSFRPTTSAIGTNYKAYRTLESIHIPNEGNS